MKSGWRGTALLAAALGACIAFAWATLPPVGDLATEFPATTALIERRAAEARAQGLEPRRLQHPVRLSAVAPHAVQAVILSEDARFWQHGGIDTVELAEAIAEAWKNRRLGRGASTITQQLAKNLWLSDERTLLRKVREAVLAKRLEATLGKKRILELYLNVVEWGPGVYGIEAAARHHFGVRASSLSVAQGAILAAMLPAPRRWIPARRPRVLERRALRIVGDLEATGAIDADAAEAARRELASFFGRPPRAESIPP